jgi:hypothetical protein
MASFALAHLICIPWKLPSTMGMMEESEKHVQSVRLDRRQRMLTTHAQSPLSLFFEDAHPGIACGTYSSMSHLCQ